MQARAHWFADEGEPAPQILVGSRRDAQQRSHCAVRCSRARSPPGRAADVSQPAKSATARPCCVLSSAPSGELVPDVAANLPGRGLWLTPRREIVERALAKRLFPRAARRPVLVPQELCGSPGGVAGPAVLRGARTWRAGPVSRLPGLRRCAKPSAPERWHCCCRQWTAPRAGGARSAALGRGLPVATVLTRGRDRRGFWPRSCGTRSARRRPVDRPAWPAMRKSSPDFARGRQSTERWKKLWPGRRGTTVVLDRDERRERARAEHDRARGEAAADPWARRPAGAAQTGRDCASAPELLARALEDGYGRGSQEARDRPRAARRRPSRASPSVAREQAAPRPATQEPARRPVVMPAR